MNCIGFPKMFQANSTIVYTGYEASKVCLRLLLGSEQGEMFGDPQFCVRIKKYAYNQNNYVLRDVIIDELATKINLFCPQILVTRDNISIQQEGKNLVAHIEATNRASFTTDMYDLVLLNEEE